MEVIETNRIKSDNKGWKIVPFVFLTAALSPEYVAPVVLVLSVIYTMCKKGFNKKSFNSFSIGYAILFFIAWMVVGMLYANSIISSLASVGLWLMMFSGMWMCGEWINSTEKMEKVFFAGALAGGISGLIGIFQMAVKMLWPSKFVLVNPIWAFINVLVEKLVPLLPDFITSNMGSKYFIIFPDRACGPFSNPLFFATFEVAMIPFAMYFFLNGKKTGHKVLGFISLVLTLGGIATSYSRGPYVVTVVVFLMLLAYGGKKALKILALGAVCLVAILVAFKDVVARLLTLGSTDDFSVNTRKQIYDAVFEKIPEKFIAGYGTGFDSVREILHNEYNIRQPHAHNILLEIQMENGIIGVVLFLAICLVFAYSILKLYKMRGTARGFAITLFVSFMGMCMCGMTDCIFYGLKPLQYMMLVLGLTQACLGIFSKKEEIVANETEGQKSEATV